MLPSLYYLMNQINIKLPKILVNIYDYLVNKVSIVYIAGRIGANDNSLLWFFIIEKRQGFCAYNP